MPVAARQPLNYDAPDLVAAREYQPLPLDALINHSRAEMHRCRVRLEKATHYARLNYRPRGVHIDTPEVAGANYRYALSVLHHLLALEEQTRGGTTSHSEGEFS